MKKSHFALFLFFIAIACTALATPKPVGFANYSHNEGLHNRYARYVAEDEVGFLWIATNGGVYRFDGANFKSYTSSDFTTGLLSNKCRTVHVDSQGTIWVGTDHGPHRYDPIKDLFKPVVFELDTVISVYKDKRGIPSMDVKCFYEHNDMLFIGTRRNGIICYSISKQQPIGQINSKTIPTDIKLSDITTLIAINQHEYYLAVDNVGLVQLNLKDSTLKEFDSSYSNGIPSPYIKSLEFDADSNLWIGSDDGLTKMIRNQNTPEFHHYFGEWISNPTPNYIKDVKIIDNDVWCATDDGIWILNQADHMFTVMQHDISDPVTILHNRVKQIHEDRNGNVWVSTDDGISKYAPDLFIFTKQSLAQKQQIIGFAELDTLTIIAAENGLFIRGVGFDRHIPSPLINSLAVHNGHVWVGTNEGLYEIDIYEKNINWIKHSDLAITYLLFDDADRLWLGHSQGLRTGTLVDNDWEFISVGAELLNRGITCIVQNSLHQIVVSQWDAFYEHSIVQLSLNPTGQWEATSKASYLQINDLEPADDNGMWVATNEEGLFHFDKDWTKIQQYNLDNGLPSSDAKAIVKDSAGHVWVSTMRGIALIEHGIRLTQTYTISNGLPTNEFKKHSSIYSSTGSIKFGGMTGWSEHNPRLMSELAPYSTPFFKRVSCGSGDWNSGMINQLILTNTPIELKYTDEVFSVAMAAINLGNNTNGTIAYRLKGFDKAWRKARGNQTETSYTNIRPGKYTLELRAANDKGQYGDKTLRLQIIITPPIWKTWWFRLGATLLTLGLVIGLSRSYLSRLKRKEAAQRQIVELEQKALRSQMNPHFIFNSLNSIQAYIAKHESDLAIDYLSSFSKLMRMILQASIDGRISVDQEVAILSNYLGLERIRFSAAFDFQITIDESIESDIMFIPPMLIQPAVENAIIHGVRALKNGQIDLNFWLENEVIYCAVTDNGQGRHAAAEHNEMHRDKDHVSTAVKVTEERLQFLFNTTDASPYFMITDLKDDVGNATGTKVVIAMPMTLRF